MLAFIDLTGKRFGRLEVINYHGRDKHGGSMWKCKCECGNVIITKGNSLRMGVTKSCGCLQREIASENCRKIGGKNKIDLTGERFSKLLVVRKISYAKQTGTLYECLCDCGNYTTASGSHLKRGQIKSCGCLVLEKNVENIINLHEFNEENIYKEGTSLPTLTAKKSVRNTSGAKGVWWKSQTEKWCAEIFFKGSKHFLGCFEHKEDAIKARKEAEEKYFVPILEKYRKETYERFNQD